MTRCSFKHLLDDYSFLVIYFHKIIFIFSINFSLTPKLLFLPSANLTNFPTLPSQSSNYSYQLILYSCFRALPSILRLFSFFLFIALKMNSLVLHFLLLKHGRRIQICLPFLTNFYLCFEVFLLLMLNIEFLLHIFYFCSVIGICLRFHSQNKRLSFILAALTAFPYKLKLITKVVDPWPWFNPVLWYASEGFWLTCFLTLPHKHLIALIVVCTFLIKLWLCRSTSKFPL